jgi:2-dehydro-3-deoxygluconokinase
MTQPDIIAIGEPLAELNQIEPNGPFHLGYGGDTSNCVIAAARAGAATGFITRVGCDFMGDGLMALWAREGVDARHVRRDRAPTGIYFITHGPEGHEFTYVRKSSAASMLSPADIDPAYVAGAAILHVSAISQAISDSACEAVSAAIDAARAAGREVSYDTNLRLKLWSLEEARKTIFATIPHATILRPSLDDARVLLSLTDADAIADAFLRMGARRVVMTLGREGALAATASERHRIPPQAVRTVDASGAGDAFSGAFLAEFLRTRNLERAARFANAAAALSVTRMGTIASYGSRDEILRLLPGSE